MLAGGLGERSVYGPAMFQAPADNRLVYACLLSPLRRVHSAPLPSNPVSVALVAILLRAGAPFAILGKVPKLVVDAVQRVLRPRSRTHVTEELLEVVPLRADGDSPASVAVVLDRIGIVTAGFHALPGVVLGSTAPAMLADRRHYVFRAQTPTGLAATIQDTGRVHSTCGATDAPHVHLSFPRNAGQYSPAPKCITDNISCLHCVCPTAIPL